MFINRKLNSILKKNEKSKETYFTAVFDRCP